MDTISWEQSVGHEIAQIYVGNPPTHFAIHLKLIADRSEFFNAALNGRFMEGGTHEMYLPEDDPAAFSALAEWLYSGTLRRLIPTKPKSVNSVSSVSSIPPGILASPKIDNSDVFIHICAIDKYKSISQEELRLRDYSNGLTIESVHDLDRNMAPTAVPVVNHVAQHEAPTIKKQLTILKLICFAEKVCWTELFNHAISAYIRGWINLQSWPSCDHINEAYENTHNGSSLRRYISDCTFHQMTSYGRYAEFANTMSQHPSYLQDMLSLQEKYHRLAAFHDSPHNKGKCAYHDHDLGQFWDCSVAY